MVEPNSFHIQLQGHGIYYGGQTIEGQVRISSCVNMPNIRNVQIKLSGFGNVQWTEKVRKEPRCQRHGEKDEDYYDTKHFTNHEEYISNKFLVHQGALAAGNHVLPFSFILPPNLPSSFEGQHGHVRYFIEAEIDPSGFFTFNKSKKQFITINSICDLNLIQGATNPQTNSNTKTFGLLCCTSGPLSATVRIPRYGYTSGESIPISAEIENMSDKPMSCTNARLYQDVTFRAMNGSKSTTRVLQEIRKGPIQGGASDSWEEQPLSIPAVPPSGLGGCRIIDVSYRLKFTVVPKAFGLDLEVTIPITLGNIPLKRYFQQIAAARNNYPQPNASLDTSNQLETNKLETFLNSAAAPPPYQPNNISQTDPSFSPTIYNPTAPHMPPTGYAELPPPVYSDAVAAYEDGRPNQLRCDQDSEHTDANWDFNPRYPVWSRDMGLIYV